MDPVSGLCQIRPFCSQTWKFLRAAYKCPFFLLSATMEENSLSRVLGIINFIRGDLGLFNKYLETLEIKREEISILFKSPDRPNIFSQVRNLKNSIDVM